MSDYETLSIDRSNWSLSGFVTVYVQFYFIFFLCVFCPSLPQSSLHPFSSCCVSTSLNPNYLQVSHQCLISPASLLVNLNRLLFPSCASLSFVRASSISLCVRLFVFDEYCLKLPWVSFHLLDQICLPDQSGYWYNHFQNSLPMFLLHALLKSSLTSSDSTVWSIMDSMESFIVLLQETHCNHEGGGEDYGEKYRDIFWSSCPDGPVHQLVPRAGGHNSHLLQFGQLAGFDSFLKMCWQWILKITYSWWLFSVIWILNGEILYTVTHQSPVPLLLHYLRVSWDESVKSKDGSSLYIQGILEFGGGFLYCKSSHLSTTFPVSRYHRPSSGSPPPKGHLYTPSGGETMGRMGASPLLIQTLSSLFLC